MTPTVSMLTQSECKALRLIRLMSYLDAGHQSTAEEVARRFKISKRTAERDLAVASRLLPIIEHRGVLYGIWDEED